MSDLAKFKEDYPDTYEKFLEMNRALAKLSQALLKERSRHTTEPVEAGELPNMLEWE